MVLNYDCDYFKVSHKIFLYIAANHGKVWLMWLQLGVLIHLKALIFFNLTNIIKEK